MQPKGKDQISSDLGGCKISWDGTNFWAQNRNSKKKLGSFAYTLPAMNFYVQDGDSGLYPCKLYLPLQGASSVSFRFAKLNNYGMPSATINYVDGSTQQVFSLGRGTHDQTYSITLTKDASNICFDLPNDSTVTNYWIYNFTVS